MKRKLIKLGLGSAGAFVAFNALTIPGMLTHPLRTLRSMRNSNQLHQRLGNGNFNQSQLAAMANSGWIGQELHTSYASPSERRSAATALGLKPDYDAAFVPAPATTS